MFGDSHFAETIKPVVRADDEQEAGALNDVDNEVFEVIEEKRYEVPARTVSILNKDNRV